MTTVTKLRFAVTIGALAVAVAHLVWPDVKVDAVTVALLVIAVLPWLAPLVKSVELPGGLKIELQDLKQVESRANTAGLLAVEAAPAEAARFAFEAVAAQDPNLALAGLRIEIEKRLQTLARAYQLDTGRPMGVGQLLRTLTRAEVLTGEERAVLADMTNMLNAAVHGADVGTDAAQWAIGVGPRLLTSLDERIAEAPGA
ncbi:MAG TPA: hypothetical protein DCP20_02170 [Coriobacteriia bacterium]|nr:hypothetical protein [Coriobacteriia bacterium]